MTWHFHVSGGVDSDSGLLGCTPTGWIRRRYIPAKHWYVHTVSQPRRTSTFSPTSRRCLEQSNSIVVRANDLMFFTSIESGRGGGGFLTYLPLHLLCRQDRLEQRSRFRQIWQHTNPAQPPREGNRTFGVASPSTMFVQLQIAQNWRQPRNLTKLTDVFWSQDCSDVSQKLPAIYETGIFMAVFTAARHRLPNRNFVCIPHLSQQLFSTLVRVTVRVTGFRSQSDFWHWTTKCRVGGGSVQLCRSFLIDTQSEVVEDIWIGYLMRMKYDDAKSFFLS